MGYDCSLQLISKLFEHVSLFNLQYCSKLSINKYSTKASKLIPRSLNTIFFVVLLIYLAVLHLVHHLLALSNGLLRHSSLVENRCKWKQYKHQSIPYHQNSIISSQGSLISVKENHLGYFVRRMDGHGVSIAEKMSTKCKW